MSQWDPDGHLPLGEGGGVRAFGTTHWSVILTACDGESEEASAALERLCRSYWYPIYAHARRQGRGPEDAQDLTQAFFARLLEKGYLKLANPRRGRFRTFLLTSLGNFITNEWEKGRALKRGSGCNVPLLVTENGEERYRHEPPDGASPDKIYDRRWAATLLENVVKRLRAEYVALQKDEFFEALKDAVWGDGIDPGYQALGARLKMTEGALRVAAHRMRERYRTLLREAVAQTVSAPEDVDDELRHLIAVLRE